MEQSRLPGGWSNLLASDANVIGVEIGSRGQRVVLANGAGRILSKTHSIGSPSSFTDAVTTVRNLVQQACEQAGTDLSGVVRIGIAFGGPVDVERGLTLLSPRTPGFENVPLVNLIEDELGVPTILDNGARAAALGEVVFGAARGSQNVVYVHLGTGVGGGIIVDGRLIHGTTSTAGEIGHMVVSSGGPICSCGKPGHLEAYAAAPSIVARFRDRLQTAPQSSIDEWSSGGAVTVRAIFARARGGDPLAEAVVDETVHVLGLAISNLITVLNPGVVIVGGAVADVGTLLIDPLRAKVRQYSYPVSARRVRVTLTQLRADAAVLGGVALALDAFRS